MSFSSPAAVLLILIHLDFDLAQLPRFGPEPAGFATGERCRPAHISARASSRDGTPAPNAEARRPLLASMPGDRP